MSEKLTVLFIKMETEVVHQGKDESPYYVLGKGTQDEHEVRGYTDFNKGKQAFVSLFDDISPVRTEFYQKLFLAAYQPRIVTIENPKDIDMNIVHWGEMDNQFFTIVIGQLYPFYAEKLWNAGEPLVFANCNPELA